VQRFCNALPLVLPRAAPYLFVLKIRRFVDISLARHAAEFHRVSASSVGNAVGNPLE
jgi:hypothetical protein